jgi:HEAT repeat protein
MKQRTNILALLKGGNRRSIGRSNEVAAAVLVNPKLFAALVKGLWDEDPLVCMRAADSAEKVTRERPDLLVPYKEELLGLMAEATQQELRWHLAVMIPRLPLTAKERQTVVDLLIRYLEDRSSIVKTFALQGLAELAQGEPEIISKVVEILRTAARSGTPAMKARSRKLLAQFEQTDNLRG